MVKNPLKFYFIGSKDNRKERTGVMTVATEVDSDQVKVAFAFCSPKDNFNRILGRKIAYGRLVAEGKHVIVPFTGHSANDVTEIYNTVVRFQKTTPRIWKKRTLANIPETGLTFLREV